jgi:hypothetical protein
MSIWREDSSMQDWKERSLMLDNRNQKQVHPVMTVYLL